LYRERNRGPNYKREEGDEHPVVQMYLSRKEAPLIPLNIQKYSAVRMRNLAINNKFRALEMDFWRRSAGRPRLEEITNDKIRKIMKVETTIVEEIQLRQLIWYEHVERMEDTRIPKQILKWTPIEKRKTQDDMDRRNRESYVGTKPATRGLGRQKRPEKSAAIVNKK